MKLLYCPKCQDVKKLQYERRECKCGASWGWYKEDGLYAVIGGICLPFGIDNQSFARARGADGWFPNRNFVAFVITPDCETVERMGDNPKERNEPPSTQ